jgi:hypothetical protein
MRMRNLKKLSRDKKGVSSLFIAIYISLLVVVLITTLFIGISTSRSALADYLKVEQERMQENILITGPKGLKLSPDESTVESIQVSNTGSIPVRIRALYIDEKLVCDPAEFPGDAYIAPKKAIWINLTGNVNPPVALNDTTLNAMWTVTTERGTKSSEIGSNLLFGSPYTPSTSKFYFGPLLIIFDMFYWTNDGTHWHSGWSIPAQTSNVTWRILLADVDDRPITINDTSFFTLIGNLNQQNKVLYWYVNTDPLLTSTMTFIPQNYYFVSFSLSKPISEGGKLPANAQGITGLSEWASCTNFLVFTGHFTEKNGTQTPFGQTIPFEAVLITP